jgi:small subunit ribosomal protein S2
MLSLSRQIKLKKMDLKENLKTKQSESEKMVEAGLCFGHKTNSKHPKMKPYIYGTRNGVSIIDVKKTEEKLTEALNFIEKIISENGLLMVVGTKVQLKEIVRLFAEETSIPYVVERWLGGTFTNFETIKKRVDYLRDLEKKQEEGDLEKYTKKERLDISREIDSLKVKFDGLKLLNKIPDAILILDMKKEEIALKEARAKNIKIIAIADTNVNPELSDYPIPSNDDSISSVSYILDKIKKVILSKKED